MKTARALPVVVAVAVAAALAACRSHDEGRHAGHDRAAARHAEPRCGTCDAGRRGDAVWCDRCGKGWAEGRPTGCRKCWEDDTGRR